VLVSCMARAIIRVNSAALPVTLVESELFGYERGAFTGAVTAKAGRLELANHGTLFLDEVGELPLEVQPKLLRAVQEREFERLGGTGVRRVDVRLIAATNRDLEEMVEHGTFRADLYYRLSVFPIRVPPLRERPEDIPPLVRHFVAVFSRDLGRRITSIPAKTMEALQRWQWPGNIRELQNVIERAVILSSGTTLEISPAAFQARIPKRVHDAAPASLPYDEGQRQMILAALRETGGVVGGPEGAAARLGLTRTTLQSKMRRLGIKRPSF
jgi:formate hydrogenlyase transcriptional activator